MKQCPSLLTTALSHNLIMSHHLSFPCSPHVAGSKDAQACNPPKFSFAKSPTSFCLICYTFPPVEQEQRMHKLATPQNPHLQNLPHLSAWSVTPSHLWNRIEGGASSHPKILTFAKPGHVPPPSWNHRPKNSGPLLSGFRTGCANWLLEYLRVRAWVWID